MVDETDSAPDDIYRVLYFIFFVGIL